MFGFLDQYRVRQSHRLIGSAHQVFQELDRYANDNTKWIIDFFADEPREHSILIKSAFSIGTLFSRIKIKLEVQEDAKIVRMEGANHVFIELVIYFLLFFVIAKVVADMSHFIDDIIYLILILPFFFFLAQLIQQKYLMKRVVKALAEKRLITKAIL